jgi:Phage tail tube protein, GTA-gp10
LANRHRGEIEAELSGRTYVLCLTLGALAELEHAYGGADLIAIAEKFETGRVGAADAIRILGCALRGAGNDVSDADVARMTIAGGAAGFLSLVAELLTATFQAPDATPGNA